MTPDIGQTQLHLSLLRRESRAAVLPSPLVLLDNYADCVGAPTPTTADTMDHPVTITTLVNLATRTPTLITFVPGG